MEQYGFQLREAGQPYPKEDALLPPVPQGELFGVGDPALGYAAKSIPERDEAARKMNENNQYLASLPAASEAYSLAYSGRYKRATDTNIPESLDEKINGIAIHPTGCEGWSWDRIAEGDTSEAVNLLTRDLEESTWEAAATDSRATDANRAWSECIRERGYDYPDPDTMQRAGTGSLPVQPPPPPVTPEQAVAMATADDACREETGYAQIRYDVLMEYQHAAIDEHHAELQAVRDRFTDEVAAAAAAIEQGR